MEQVAMSLHNEMNTFGNQFQAPVIGVKHPSPWLNDVIRINTTLTWMKKSETSTEKCRQEDLSLLQKKNCHFFYDLSMLWLGLGLVESAKCNIAVLLLFLSNKNISWLVQFVLISSHFYSEHTNLQFI
jgi:hypothetical protein